MDSASRSVLVTIACGGTGGHLFPGLAVAEALRKRGADVQLLISAKAVDLTAAASVPNFEAVPLPAQPPSWRRLGPFLRAFGVSCRMCLGQFRKRRPIGLLAMGAFASAPAVVAARMAGLPIFLHEANAVPGRGNRWLSPFARQVFVYFPEAAGQLRRRRVCVTGMPVRPEFRCVEAGPCRRTLGLEPEAPVLLAMGGSQGARPLNQLMEQAIGTLASRAPELQYVHITGRDDVERMRRVYRDRRRRAVVHSFLNEPWLAFGAATLAVTRAGASSLAEQAAMRLPAILIPYPHAAGNHQYYNAQAFARTGAACVLPQADATAETLANLVLHLLRDAPRRSAMQNALGAWHAKDAADQIAQRLLSLRTAQTDVSTQPDSSNLPVASEIASSHANEPGY